MSEELYYIDNDFTSKRLFMGENKSKEKIYLTSKIWKWDKNFSGKFVA